MSSEDVAAREDAERYRDSRVPMALEPKPEPRPSSLKSVKLPKPDSRARASKAGYAKAMRLAVREERVRRQAGARASKAREKCAAKAAARQEKIDAAAEGYCDLPAVVFRSGEVRHVTAAEAVEIVSLYLGALCLDCETSGYWIGHRNYELRTVQLGGEEMAVVLDAADEKQMMVASWALKSAAKIHAHSETADLVPCVHAGLTGWDEAWAKAHDSVLYAKLSDPSLTGSEANGLKDLARDLLREYAVSPEAERKKNLLFKAIGCNVNTDSSTPAEKNGWNMVPKTAVAMIRYAGCDVLDLAAVLRTLPALPVPQEVLERERRVQAVCARVAYEGAELDHGHIAAKIEEHEASKISRQKNVSVLTDGLVANPSSPDTGKNLIALHPHLSGVLEVSEKTGEPSAAKKSLEKVKGDGIAAVTAREILAYRHDVTTLGLLLRPLEDMCLHGDSRMRPVVYTISADTGRMSTVRPNSQQFSKRGGIRACVRAPRGFKGISADFTGCEIRVAAALSGDRALLEAETSLLCYACDSDPCSCGKQHTGLHWLAAHLTFGSDAEKIHRYQAKAVIFRKLFGGAPDSAVAQQIADVFDARIAPAFAAWDRWLRRCWYEGSMVWRDYAQDENYSVPLERKRYGVYKTYSGRNIYVAKGAHAFVNYAVQGTARELLVDALLRWADGPYGSSVVIPIHDEVISFVAQDVAQEASDYLVKCMETSVLSVPGWDVFIGADPDDPWDSWQDAA